jgi:hypothetical protein
MAPEAVLPFFVNLELGRVLRMLYGNPVAVFAVDYCVRGCHYQGILLGVAVLAVIAGFKFDLEALPVLLVSLPMPSIHVSAFLHAEIRRDDKRPRCKYKGYEGKHNIKGFEHMAFHLWLFPFWMPFIFKIYRQKYGVST